MNPSPSPLVLSCHLGDCGGNGGKIRPFLVPSSMDPASDFLSSSVLSPTTGLQASHKGCLVCPNQFSFWEDSNLFHHFDDVAPLPSDFCWKLDIWVQQCGNSGNKGPTLPQGLLFTDTGFVLIVPPCWGPTWDVTWRSSQVFSKTLACVVTSYFSPYRHLFLSYCPVSFMQGRPSVKQLSVLPSTGFFVDVFFLQCFKSTHCLLVQTWERTMSRLYIVFCV